MQHITPGQLVRAINDLPRDRSYRYVNPSTRTHIKIQEVQLPVGPIYIKRFNPSRGESESEAQVQTISTHMLARIAGAFIPYRPINFDRVLGGSYNTRSALEALLAHAPQFFTCMPGRVDSYTGEEVSGHKHLMWCPDDAHRLGEITSKETDIVISELPTADLPYDGVVVPPELLNEQTGAAIQRQHARIQVALILIGQKLGFKTWIAQNDHAIVYKDKRLNQLEGVIPNSQDIKLLESFESASTSIRLIDCVWFSNTVHMPAVMEIEHSTGVITGLVRMQKFQEKVPSLQTRYVIIAPDADKQKVAQQVNEPQFSSLNAKFFPYSGVEELLWISQRRELKGTSRDFIESFMESV